MLIACCIMTGVCLTAFTMSDVKNFTNCSIKNDSLVVRRVDLRAELDTARADFIKCVNVVKVLQVSLDSVLKVNATLVDACNYQDNKFQLAILIGITILIFLTILF